MVAKRWKDLTQGQRKLIVVAAAVEAALKAAMLVDLRRRPPEQVRGPKWAWAATALVNSAGIVQLVYFALGRRREG
jgi:hypothetical protein